MNAWQNTGRIPIFQQQNKHQRQAVSETEGTLNTAASPMLSPLAATS
jgi:hypothetical protein